MKYLLITFLCLPLVVSAQRIEKSFSDVEDINLTTGSGDIEVRKASGNEVTVILEHSYGDDYNPSIELRGSRLVIKDGKNKSWSGEQKFTLIVPDDLDINFTTGSGNISADGITTDFKGTTGSGDLSFSSMKGEVSVNSGSGDLEVENFDGELSLNVGSGDAEVENYKGELSINCGSGDIELDSFEGAVRINTGSGSVELDNAKLTGKSALNAGSGDIDVVLSSALEADLSINTGSGDSKLNMGGNAFTGTIVMEADKRKGKIEADFDFDKTEEIEEHDQVKIRKTAVMGNSNIKIKMSTGSGVTSAEK